MEVNVIGAGLAGSECALQLAKQGIKVNLYEMRPEKMTGAHVSENFAEFVCSNSLGSYDITNASGLLKHEMEILGSELIKVAYECQVPAGGALAIDRELFSKRITQLIEQNPNINIIKEEITQIFDIPTVIASGPLTSDGLANSIKEFTQSEHLHFFDAIAPIVECGSINFDTAFYANRYDKEEAKSKKLKAKGNEFIQISSNASYINCPMDREQYEKFYNILINAPKIELKEFEKDAKFFESCLPIEVLASRGFDTLRFGPMKPVGLIDKRTGKENYAVVQLRQDNSAKTLYNLVGFQTNLKWSAQKELLHSIPGLENANIVRYGVMHRNTFINSPKVLNATLQTRKRPDLFFAGQITGVEGYTESIATGMLAGINMARYLKNIARQVCPLCELPRETMLGALCAYISDKNHEKFQPINSNWGIVTPIDLPKKDRKNKKLKNELLAKRSIEYLNNLEISKY
ncbi:MAG: methylenetetrahydrofolate--tRNA-(uracil(54)-C(5))-methyltransferase (FADH(2)-oxidizing) TrmFO [Candidatus Gastranaerophilales bacterium]|nr:methylenetetrahydrofolate--tRNA-(uracil(54)-C(5))-methyltransferase (FADH(2)-oxidizing) TrmFO [Candidatus Gastranaerophilales bacterium]